MQNPQIEIPSSEISPHIHWGHFGTIMGVIVLLLGVTWLSKPQLFDFKKVAAVSNADVPHYYAYVPPADDLPQPEVLGASTDQGPSIINEDGSVTPVDSMGQVLGANTQDPNVSLDSITVNTVPDSDASIKRYLSDDKAIETSPIENGDFEAALTSNDQNLMNQQASKLIPIRDALEKLVVPSGFSTLQKLKIIQYNSAIALLQNFGQMNQNPELVGQDLQDYLTSQQQLADEITSVAQAYNLDPNSIGPAGEAAVLTGAVQGASQGAAEASAALAAQASSTSASSLSAATVSSADNSGMDISGDASGDDSN
jgi:hypothetical protein